MAGDRQMFTDALDQGLALVAPGIDDEWRERIVEQLVRVIGVWEPPVRGERQPPRASDAAHERREWA